jgi:hypothetical protein
VAICIEKAFGISCNTVVFMIGGRDEGLI